MIEDSLMMLEKLSKVRGIWDMVKFQGDYTINLGLDCNYGPGLLLSAELPYQPNSRTSSQKFSFLVRQLDFI